MAQNGAVGEFHQRVHDRLRMDQNVQLVIADAEKNAGFYQLQPLVHQGRGIDGDFRAHLPGGMAQGVFRGGGEDLLSGPCAERTARSRQRHLADRIGLSSLQKLKYGAVFRIDREHFTPRLFHGPREQRASRHQTLLVGDRQTRAAPGGRKRGLQAGGADNRGDHGVAPARRLDKRSLPGPGFNRETGQSLA